MSEALLLRDLNALLNSLYLKFKDESVRICLVVRDRNLKSNSHGGVRVRNSFSNQCNQEFKLFLQDSLPGITSQLSSLPLLFQAPPGGKKIRATFLSKN